MNTIARRFVHPAADDTLEAIARRELPDLPVEQATEQLLSWNLHLATRLVGQPIGVIGADIVYVEPPAGTAPS